MTTDSSQTLITMIENINTTVVALKDKSDQQDTLMRDAMATILDVLPQHFLTQHLPLVNRAREMYGLPPINVTPPSEGGETFSRDTPPNIPYDILEEDAQEPSMDPQETCEINQLLRSELLRNGHFRDPSLPEGSDFPLRMLPLTVRDRYAMIQTLKDYIAEPELWQRSPEEPEVSRTQLYQMDDDDLRELYIRVTGRTPTL